EVDDNTVIASHRRFQNSGSSTIVYYGDAGILPFATIQNKGWSVNALSVPVSGVKALSLCPFRGGKRILPAESIPVIDMKSDRHELVPEPWVVYEPRLWHEFVTVAFHVDYLDRRLEEHESELQARENVVC